MDPVPYRPEVEQASPDETQTIARISEVVTGIAEHVKDKHGKAMRATHAKPTALVKGELVVAGDLPPELAQGMFASAGTYNVLVRYAQGPSEPLSDQASGQRGMSLKVLNVVGQHVPESRETTTQDWTLAPGPAFINHNAKTFARNFANVAGKSTRVPEGVIVAGSKVARAAEAALQAVGQDSGNLRFFGVPPTHPASNAYYSQAPVRYGDFIAKIGAFPTSSTLEAIGDPSIDTAADHDGFRDAMIDYFARNDAEFDLRVQLCTDLEAMPIEDAVPVWDEEASPYRTVARLTMPKQDVYSDQRRRYFEERLAFNPWHALEAHRPLGSIMRARLQPYLAAQDFRQASDGVASAEPRSSSEVPD